MRFASYRAYKETGIPWLGRIPAHWEVVPPTALFFESKERAHESDQLLSSTQKYGVIPFAEYEELEQRQVTMAVSNLEKRKHVEIGDFVISMRSMDGGLERARAVGSVRSSYSVLKPGPNVDVRFYGALLKSSLYIQALRLTSNFIRDGQDMNFGHFRKVRLPAPSRQEQASIADFLDRETARIDQLIEKKQQLVKVLGERTERLADMIVGQFTDYPATPLRRVMIKIEQGWSPECEAREKEDHEWGVLKVGCVNGWVFRPNEHKALPTALSPRPDLEITDGDVLMSRANTRELVGSVAIVSGSPKQLMLCDKLYRLRFDLRKVRPDFAVIALRSKTARQHYEARSNGTSSSMQNIGQEAVRTLLVSLPPLEMQKKFADNFNLQLERQKRLSDAVDASVNRIREFRAALITAAVTGQIDVASWGKNGSVDRRLDAIEQEISA